MSENVPTGTRLGVEETRPAEGRLGQEKEVRNTRQMAGDIENDIQEAVAAHRRWRYHGSRQGAECECHADFYPTTGHTAAIIDAHRQHIAEALASAGFGSVVIMRQWLEENPEEKA